MQHFPSSINIIKYLYTHCPLLHSTSEGTAQLLKNILQGSGFPHSCWTSWTNCFTPPATCSVPANFNTNSKAYKWNQTLLSPPHPEKISQVHPQTQHGSHSRNLRAPNATPPRNKALLKMIELLTSMIPLQAWKLPRVGWHWGCGP